MHHDWPSPGSATNDPLTNERCIAAFDAELDYLFASLRRLGARPGEIEDLAHEIFLILLRNRRMFSERRSTLRLRLFALAVRVVAQHHRRAAGAPGGAPASLPLSLAALERVPLKRRAVLLLHDLDQVPLAAIAGSLSMTRLGVAVRLRKARRELDTAIRQLAADWQAGRFGRPDLLLASLGLRSKHGWAPAAPDQGRADADADPGAEAAALDTQSREAIDEIVKLQDEIFLLEMVMDDLPDTIYFKDRESRFTRINRHAAAHYGIVNPALAVGRTDFDFFTDEHAVQALRDEQQIIRTGRPLMSVEERETLPDGKLRWVWTTKLPLRDRGGDIVGTFGLSRDITARRLART